MTEHRRNVQEGHRISRVTDPDDSHVEAAVRGMARESVVVLCTDDETYIRVWQPRTASTS